MNNIGIMQGRLCPRGEKYQVFPGREAALKEFGIAKNLGFSHIELIADDHIENFLNKSNFLSQLKKASVEAGVGLKSICADIFMTKTLFGPTAGEAKKILIKLIDLASELHVEYITLPFVDSSSLEGKEDFKTIERTFHEVLPYAKKKKITLCLETDLEPKDFGNFLRKLPYTNLRVNYDTGNSASLGYDIDKEFQSYGNYISVIHIKDRKENGKSVELGEGDVQWEKFFKNIKRIKFNGVMTLQASRAIEGEAELVKVQRQLNTFKKLVEKYG